MTALSRPATTASHHGPQGLRRGARVECPVDFPQGRGALETPVIEALATREGDLGPAEARAPQEGEQHGTEAKENWISQVGLPGAQLGTLRRVEVWRHRSGQWDTCGWGGGIRIRAP